MSVEYAWNTDGDGESDGERIVETVEHDEADLDLPGLLPDDFWKARPVFGKIRQAAWSEGCSGDVLFWALMARESGMLSHHIRMKTGIGGRGSLNIFASPVGPPGTGKSTSAALAPKLATTEDEDFLDGLPIGTGEGIAEMYMGTDEEKTGGFYKSGPKQGEPITKAVRRQLYHNGYIYVDEGGVLDQLNQRNGSTLHETIRCAAVGQSIGQTNATEERRRFIKAETYSLGMLIGFQPTTAQPLLADHKTGTPQRYFWSWAQDPNIPEEPPEWPGEFEWHPGLLRPTEDVNVRFPDDIRKMLWDERRARNQGKAEGGPYDGHANLLKAKLASMFALFDLGEDGRKEQYLVIHEDWELAELVWACSCLVRDELIADAKRSTEAAREIAEKVAVDLAVRTEEAKSSASTTLMRIARCIVTYVGNENGGLTKAAAYKKVAYRDREKFESALDFALSQGWLVENEDHLGVGRVGE